MEWVLGLDGGGSKTLLALADRQGRVLGPVRAEGINPFDNPAWKVNFTGLIERCPRPLSEVAYAALGMPGYGEVHAVSAEQEMLARATMHGGRFAVLNDVQAAFVGALAGQPGVLLLSGTGSMAWAGDGDKHSVRVGGWGDGFGDEGSAYWIGKQALSALSKALDGRIIDPAFATAMMEAIGVQAGGGLLAWFYGLEHPRSGVARLAKVVDGLAGLGNPTATRLLEGADDELILLAQTAFRLLNEPTANRFSYAGSVFDSNTIRERVRGALEPLGSWRPPVLNPVGGALLYAAGRAGWTVDQDWMGNVGKGLQALA